MPQPQPQQRLPQREQQPQPQQRLPQREQPPMLLQKQRQMLLQNWHLIAPPPMPQRG
jgi:hypothetical protein